MILNNITNIVSDINRTSFNNYLMALIIFAVSISILRIFKFVIIKKLRKIVEKTETKYDDIFVDMIDKIGWPFYALLSLYITFNFLGLAQGGIFSDIRDIIYYIITIVAVYYAIIIIQAIIDYGTKIAIKQREKDAADASIIDLLSKIIKGALWIIAFVLILSNLGYNVTTLVAGLGIGGIAIAFALQNILGDIFASFSIYLDRPFKTGDYIIFGTEEGTVKDIGIKSTRVEALQGQEIIVSNKQLTETIVHNYKRMDYRRVLFNISIKYDTPSYLLERIPNITKEIITDIEKTRFSRTHFKKFGELGYVFEIVYIVNSGNYEKYMDIQQQINFAIKKRFDEEGIEMAYKYTDKIFVDSNE